MRGPQGGRGQVACEPSTSSPLAARGARPRLSRALRPPITQWKEPARGFEFSDDCSVQPRRRTTGKRPGVCKEIVRLILVRDSRVREQFSCGEHLSVLALGGDRENQNERRDRRGSGAKRGKTS